MYTLLDSHVSDTRIYFEELHENSENRQEREAFHSCLYNIVFRLEIH